MQLDDIDKNPFDKAAHDIYSLYFVGWLFGFLAFIIGCVWAMFLLQKPQLPELYQSHYRFQIHIALQGLMVLVASVAAWYVVYPHLSLLYWWRALLLTVVTCFLPIYWWIKRCIMGFTLLRANQAIANPRTFSWPRAFDNDH